MIIRKFYALLSLFLIWTLTSSAQNTEKVYWPKTIPLEQITLTIYQPQLEEFSGNTIQVRCAFNFFDGTRMPIFGAIWLKARVQINRTDQTVFYDQIELVDVNFPDITTAKKVEFSELLASVTPTWQFNSDLNVFTTAVDIVQSQQQSSNGLNNNPPNIFYEQTPTELVFIDGEPILRDIDGSSLYQYIINTPYFIIRSESDGYFYLKTGPWWFRAQDIYNDWQSIGAPPQPILSLAERSEDHSSINSNETITNSTPKPQLFVVHEQAALIETQGEPELVSIPGTSLMYVNNTTNNLLKDNQTQEFYVLFAGRWYKSKTLYRGDWQFVAPDNLPSYFKKIQAQSKIGHLRLNISGTQEAMNGALDNAIPQTAVVDRNTAEIKVEYDGAPVFEKIEGTSLAYAVNTDLSIVKTAANEYYAVDEAVWFTSNSPTENWQVATSVPSVINEIPPSAQVYNIKYVYIYEFDDNYVYTGYTGGYTGTFLFQGCLFYGTGYQYKPWYKDKYYPRPTTFAFGVNRTGGGNSNVHVTIGVGYGYPGYYSPYGYYGGYGYGSYTTASLDGNFTYKKGYETKPLDVTNIYNNRAKGIIRSDQAIRNDPFKVVPEGQQNENGGWVPPTNLYSDQTGNIYKQDDAGQWYLRQDGVWVKTKATPYNK